MLKKNHLDEQYVARRSVRDLPATIASLSERLSKLTADEATANAHADDPITIGGRTYPREDIPDILGGKLDALPKQRPRDDPHPARHLSRPAFRHGASSAIPARRVSRRRTTRQATLSRDHQGPRAVLNALERLANGYGSECDRVRQDLAIAESQLRDYQARLGKPFPHDAYLSELTTLRDQLKAGLSGTAHEPGKEEGPSVSELAEQIKALKAANTIEATPQRDRQKHSTAEEPITARIRRRHEASPISTQPIEQDATHRAQETLPQAAAERSFMKPPMSFRERIAIDRQRRDERPALS